MKLCKFPAIIDGARVPEGTGEENPVIYIYNTADLEFDTGRGGASAASGDTPPTVPSLPPALNRL